MNEYVIVPIVEGHGEVESVPILLKKWIDFRNYPNVRLSGDGPVRANGKHSLTVDLDRNEDLGIEHYVQIAFGRQPDAILVLLDADDDCPRMLASHLLDRAKTVLPPDYPIGIVVANREYEAWFLAAFASASFRNGLTRERLGPARNLLEPAIDIESVANCKARVEDFLAFAKAEKYEETIHQPALTRCLPFTRSTIRSMTRRSRSYRKLLEELDSLLKQARRRRRTLKS